MSGGKACGKQAAQDTVHEGSVTSRDTGHTAASENEVLSSGHTHRQSMRLKEMSAAKLAGGKVWFVTLHSFFRMRHNEQPALHYN